MHVHLSVTGLILLIVAVLLFQVYGWGLILWPVAVIAAVVLLWYTVRRIAHWRTRHQRQALALRRNIARLEAEQGIPLLTEGACPDCGKPLIAGAHYCSYCKAPTPRTAHACALCGTRNAGDAIWCGACGAALEDEDAALTARRSGPVADLIAALLDSALDR